MPLTTTEALEANLTRLFDLFYNSPHPFLSVYGIPERPEADRAENYDSDFAEFKRMWRAVGLQRFIRPDIPGGTEGSAYDVDFLHSHLPELAKDFFEKNRIPFDPDTQKAVLFSPQNSLCDPFRRGSATNPFFHCYETALLIVAKDLDHNDQSKVFARRRNSTTGQLENCHHKYDLRLDCPPAGEPWLFDLEAEATAGSRHPVVIAYRRDYLGEDLSELAGSSHATSGIAAVSYADDVDHDDEAGSTLYGEAAPASDPDYDPDITDHAAAKPGNGILTAPAMAAGAWLDDDMAGDHEKPEECSVDAKPVKQISKAEAIAAPGSKPPSRRDSVDAKPGSQISRSKAITASDPNAPLRRAPALSLLGAVSDGAPIAAAAAKPSSGEAAAKKPSDGESEAAETRAPTANDNDDDDDNCCTCFSNCLASFFGGSGNTNRSGRERVIPVDGRASIYASGPSGHSK